MVDEPLPIVTLIEERMKALGLSRRQLILRSGLSNVTKGLRRLDALKHGEDLESAVALISGLPTALELPLEVIQEAVQKSEEQLARVEEAAEKEREALFRANFTVSAYLIGTYPYPCPLTIYGVSGGAKKWLKIPIDLSLSPDSFAGQALSVVRKTPQVPFWGPTTGYVVNYTPDHAVKYDVNGAVVEVLPHAHIPGMVLLALGRRKFSSGVVNQRLSDALAKIFRIRRGTQ